MTLGRKVIDYKTIAAAAIISAVLLSGGLLIGYTISKESLTKIDSDLDSIAKDIQNFHIQFLFIDMIGENATCPLLSSSISSINSRSYHVGSRLTSFIQSGEIQDIEYYKTLKSEYIRLLTSYWLLAEKMKKTCRYNTSTVIYFFADDCTDCSDQGFILTYIKSKMRDDILVFSLDGESGEAPVEVIKMHYNIREYPSFIINGEPYEGFKTREELEAIIGKGDAAKE